MGIGLTRLHEYDLECYICNCCETVYTGGSYKEKRENDV